MQDCATDRPRRSFGFVAFGNGGILIGLILFAALDRADGGLGFGSGRTGILFSLFGKYRCRRVYACSRSAAVADPAANRYGPPYALRCNRRLLRVGQAQLL